MPVKSADSSSAHLQRDKDLGLMLPEDSRAPEAERNTPVPPACRLRARSQRVSSLDEMFKAAIPIG